jgi:hypothetical protein
MFLQYNRSGQNDHEKDEWGSQTEYKRWVHAAHWKNAGSNSVIRYTEAMIYSVSVLDLRDFESIGRKMPTGQGVDGTVDNGSLAPKHKTKKWSGSNSVKQVAEKSHKCIVSAIEKSDERESKMSALRLFLEFGSTEEKLKAKAELATIAFGKAIDNSNNTGDDDDSMTSSVELVV